MPAPLPDQLRSLGEEGHRGEDGEAVGDVRIVEEEAGDVAADLEALRSPAAAEVYGIVGLGRQEQPSEAGPRFIGQHGLREAELAHAVARDARPAP
jgi:hypothetical protein